MVEFGEYLLRRGMNKGLAFKLTSTREIVMMLAAHLTREAGDPRQVPQQIRHLLMRKDINRASLELEGDWRTDVIRASTSNTSMGP